MDEFNISNSYLPENCVLRKPSLENSDELEHLIGIIYSIRSIYEEHDSEERITNLENEFKCIIDRYKEWPILLDKNLKTILDTCILIARDTETSNGLLHLIFRMLFHIVKVRGYKDVVPKMPHEPDDLELILDMLSEQDSIDKTAWPTAYVLLLWLSDACLIPFDVHNKGKKSATASFSFLQRIVAASKAYLRKSTKPQEAAAILLAKFHTRSDVAKASMKDIIAWTCTEIVRIQNDGFKEEAYLIGIFRFLVLLFKFGYRADLLPHTKQVLTVALDFEGDHKVKCYIVENLRVKLLRNIGLIFLPYHKASWLYKRKLGNVRQNIERDPQKGLTDADIFQSIDPQPDDIEDFPVEVEDILEELFKALRIPDSSTRWSTAKGISGLCSYLPLDFVKEQVISTNALLGVFQPQEGFAAWQSGCLTISESARLGVLLPDWLGDVIPLVVEALFFEEGAANASCGNSVRDSACYVFWSFARYYDPKHLEKFIKDIAYSLVLVSLFDRDVNVRRAASAAFQETVGRQEDFPHAADIVNRLDYLGVLNRQTCFLEHSEFMAHFAEYRIIMVKHIIEKKLNSHDSQIRILGAQALGRLTPFCQHFMETTGLSQILNICKTSDLNLKHGSILAISEVVLALNSPDAIKGANIEQIRRISYELSKRNTRGMGGDLMRKACYLLIENCCKIHMPFHKMDDGPLLFRNWFVLMNDSFQQHSVPVQDAACSALAGFLNALHDTWGPEGQDMEYFLTEFTGRACRSLQATDSEMVRIGYCKAVAVLPAFVFFQRDRLQVLTEALLAVFELTNSTAKWVEARRLAIHALVSVVSKAIDFLPDDLLPKIEDTFLDLMKYRLSDPKGDIGATAREAAITGFADLCKIIMDNGSYHASESFFKSPQIDQYIAYVVEHAEEKIDRTRKVAGSTFAKLLHDFKNPIPKFPAVEEVVLVFTRDICKEISWHRSEETFPLFVQLLDLPFYQRPVLLGLIGSTSCMTQMTANHATEALKDKIQRMEQHSLLSVENVLNAFLKIYETRTEARLITPMIKFLHLLISQTCCGHHLKTFADTEGLEKILELTKSKVSQTRDVSRISAALDVYFDLLQYFDIRKSVISTMMRMLCHPLPAVRKATSIIVSESLATYEGLIGTHEMTEATNTLVHTAWLANLDLVRPGRNTLCKIFDVPIPS